MSMAIDWTDIYEQYKGEWVALADDEKTVIAHGMNAKQVWDEAKQQIDKPILMQIPEEMIQFVG